LGRQPSDRERQDLYRTRDALKLKNDDALWLLLMALGHYETLYRGFPALISEAAKSTLAHVKDAAEAELKASTSATKQELTAALVRIAERATPGTPKAAVLRWAFLCLATSVVCLCFVGWFSHRQGSAAGRSRGWAEARRACADENIAAAWANTADGQLAHALARAGSIRVLPNCSGRGWVQKGGICFPCASRGPVSPWRVPSIANREAETR
jgi:hypothetical protein